MDTADPFPKGPTWRRAATVRSSAARRSCPDRCGCSCAKKWSPTPDWFPAFRSSSGCRLRPTMRRYLRRDRFRSSFPTTIFMSGGKSPDEPDGSGCVPSCDRLVSAAADCPAEQRYGKISRKRQEETPFSTRFGWKNDFRTIRTSPTFLFRRNLHHAKLPE